MEDSATAMDFLALIFQEISFAWSGHGKHCSISLVLVKRSWAMRRQAKYRLRSSKWSAYTLLSPYLACRIAWSSSNLGLDGEETHRVLEVWQRLQAL